MNLRRAVEPECLHHTRVSDAESVTYVAAPRAMMTKMTGMITVMLTTGSALPATQRCLAWAERQAPGPSYWGRISTPFPTGVGISRTPGGLDSSKERWDHTSSSSESGFPGGQQAVHFLCRCPSMHRDELGMKTVARMRDAGLFLEEAMHAIF